MNDTHQPRSHLAPDRLVAAIRHDEESTRHEPSKPTVTATYATQQELIDAQLAAIRKRVRAAGEQLESTSSQEYAAPAWPADLLAYEARVEVRLQASRAQLSITRIRDRFALSMTEERVLWLLIAHELCPLSRHMIRGLSTEHVSDPTTDVIRRIVYGLTCGLDVWRELAQDGTLRRFGFIERSDPGAELPEHRQTWKVARRVLALLHGDLEIDPSLSEIVAVEHEPPHLDDLELAGDAARDITQAFDHGDLVLVHGRVGSGRRSSLSAIAHARGLTVLRVEGRSVAKDRDAAQRQLRTIARECQLLGMTPLIRDLDALAPSGDTQDRIDLVEKEWPGLVLATSAGPIARRWKRAPVAIELAPISGCQRAALWQRAIPGAGKGDAEVLATTYPLAPALIEAAGRLAVCGCGTERMRPEHIESSLRAVLDDRLAGLAKRITVTQTWDDIVLPDDQTTAIIELLARIRERTRVYEEWGFADKMGRGLGVSALFSGPPGTGKTMAAGLIARALRVELYQVDISKIVSKWIGETEKNLAALFDAAEAGHAILLFDEADALFGKRTDVRSSNDRHANQEVNFLLQRLESFAGICILTTNHETAIDEAFRRRLSVHVRFPMPEVDERERLWSAMIPASAPRAADLGLDALAATYVMSGGYIRNAVLRAAFLAADEQGVIDGMRLARAAQLEYEALGKVVSSKQ
ncbi:MAG: ATP-binding protein [Kofleriaceae bacterium]